MYAYVIVLILMVAIFYLLDLLGEQSCILRTPWWGNESQMDQSHPCVKLKSSC